MYKLSEKDIKRFWIKVNKTNTCWLWTSNIAKNGYGTFSFQYRTKPAHRISFWLHKGDNNNLLVLHKCDVRNCVNPEHLFLGTQQDNVNDCVLKGRRNQVRTKMHCLRGHEYTIENTYRTKKGSPVCKICHSNSTRLFQIKLKKENLEFDLHKD